MSELNDTSALQASDEDLMVAFQKGDRTAFDLLYVRHMVFVYNMLLRRLGARWRDIAHDITQDVFCKVLERRDQFDPTRGSFRSWLIAITNNTRCGVLRRTKIFIQSIPSSISERLPSSLSDQMTTKELLRGLPAGEQKALELTICEELTILEAAKALNVTVGTIYNNRSSGLKRLRKRFLEQINSHSKAINNKE
jgi:RNA polymerase sigma-70 factor (ECF subfamily)